MSQNRILARRYAKGLAEQARDSGVMPEVVRDLDAVAAILDDRTGPTGEPALLRFLSTPAVRVEDKVTAVGNILDKISVGETVRNFIALVIRHHRSTLLPEILDEFAEEASALTGIRTAHVETARPLSREQESRLESVLADSLGGAVRIRQRVVPGLLAGARVRIGDKTVDGSVLGRLEALRTRLVYGHPDTEKPGCNDSPAASAVR